MTKHIIVDGSNIATEGRATPSLSQLNDAVLALMKEYPSAKVSVVVDATFGHRIARKEVAEFNKAIENNELVCPPAGVVGRGDAFILAIAEKVNGSVLSNDSYQEFHGKHKWLFDDGRLIGGKPVPHVGWVFMPRTPVRGVTSRRAVKTGKVVMKAPPVPSPEASKPMPVPKAPPPSMRQRTSNEVLPYLQFVEKNPVGSKIKATVDSFAANGVVVQIGDVRGYVPITAISSPPPRSMRDVYKVGEQVSLVITGYTASRRSVDLAVPGVVPVKAVPAKKTAPAKKSAPAKKTAPAKKSAPAKKTAPAKKSAPAKKTAPAKKSASAKKSAPAKKSTPARKSVAKKSAAKKSAGRR